MDLKTMDYPHNGTVDDLVTTCGGDEDGFRAKLIKLERVRDADGKTAIRATYQRVPFDKPYDSKELFFFDVTGKSAQEKKDLTVEQLAKGRALAFPGADGVEVFLGGEEAVVAIYRAP